VSATAVSLQGVRRLFAACRDQVWLVRNGVPVFGGVPSTDAVGGGTGGPSPSVGVPSHSHPVFAATFGWVGNVLHIRQGVLRNSDNVLRIASEGNEFIIDNVVVVYKTRATGGVVGDASVAT
jgi:hypothetical protein